MQEAERAKQESERKRSGKREICMLQERLVSDSFRRFGEGSPIFFVALCGDVVRELFARSEDSGRDAEIARYTLSADK